VTRVLVTGATGFIGRHLSRLLIERGYTVRGALRGPQPAEDFAKRMEWVRVGDIGPETDWGPALNGVTHVVHLAGLAHQVGATGPAYREALSRINTEATRALAEASSRAGVERLLFVSSIGAMASTSREVLDESVPCRPDSDYGRSKLAAEESVQRALHEGFPDWCIVRPPLVYGPGNPGNMARLLRLIDTGVPLPLGAINNRRSFVYVGNLADALEQCLFSPAASRRIYVISDGEDLSTTDLLELMGRLSGRRLRLLPVPVAALRSLGWLGSLISLLVRRPIPIDRYAVERLVESLAVDSSALRGEVGWTPPTKMEDGMAATLRAL
jgi:nucleoside-diphosphate-sugar epimerase